MGHTQQATSKPIGDPDVPLTIDAQTLLSNPVLNVPALVGAAAGKSRDVVEAGIRNPDPVLLVDAEMERRLKRLARFDAVALAYDPSQWRRAGQQIRALASPGSAKEFWASSQIGSQAWGSIICLRVSLEKSVAKMLRQKPSAEECRLWGLGFLSRAYLALKRRDILCRTARRYWIVAGSGSIDVSGLHSPLCRYATSVGALGNRTILVSVEKAQASQVGSGCTATAIRAPAHERTIGHERNMSRMARRSP